VIGREEIFRLEDLSSRAKGTLFSSKKNHLQGTLFRIVLSHLEFLSETPSVTLSSCERGPLLQRLEQPQIKWGKLFLVIKKQGS
jgi:hypothetical protein